MSTQAKWHVYKAVADTNGTELWFADDPAGTAFGFLSHAEAVDYVSTQQKQAATEKVQANPKAALALLVLAGLAAAAKKGKAK